MKQSQDSSTLRRTEIRDIFREHRGSVIELAKRVGVTPTSVSSWLKGRTTSKKIADGAQTLAHELRDTEHHDAA